MKDLANNIGLVQLLEPQDVAGVDTKTALLDRYGFESVVLTANIGTLTGVDANNHLLVKVQESDTTADVAFTDVAATDLIGAFTKIDAATEDQVIQSVGYIGAKRYTRLVFDFTGVGITAALVGSSAVVGNAAIRPVTAPAAVAAT